MSSACDYPHKIPFINYPYKFVTYTSDMPILFHSLWVDFKASVVIPKEYARMNKEIIPYV